MTKNYNLFFLFIQATLFCLISNNIYCQKQCYNWYFGLGAGIEFLNDSIPPVAINNSGMSVNEGSASISDENGKLLFYTDGESVWDSTNTLMPNGGNIAYGKSSTQAAIIVQDPGNEKKYYVFCTDASGTGKFSYSLVDMTLNSGRGDVSVKHNVLYSIVSEKLTAVKHKNGKDVWVIIHASLTENFIAYLVTPKGILLPIITAIGTKHNTGADSQGYMKVSPNGRKLALTINGDDAFEVFDFDNATGNITHYVKYPSPYAGVTYGLEFSPCSNYLYGTSNKYILRWDLETTNSVPTIIDGATQTIAPGFCGLQLGPDGKIYVSPNESNALSIINFPDSLNNVHFTLNAIPLGKTTKIGLPNFVTSYFENSGACKESSIYDDSACLDFFIPNAFSPNNDFHNDTLLVRGNETCIRSFSFSVFNRWGEKVFESTNIKKGWDGRAQNLSKSSSNAMEIDITPNVYFYTLEAVLKSGKSVSIHDDISLVK